MKNIVMIVCTLPLLLGACQLDDSSTESVEEAISDCEIYECTNACRSAGLSEPQENLCVEGCEEWMRMCLRGQLMEEPQDPDEPEPDEG